MRPCLPLLLLAFLTLFFVSPVSAATVYINDPNDLILFNFTGTALSPAALEAARLLCQANLLCSDLTVQNNGNYIGQLQWNFISIQRPPWTPYPYVESGAFNLIHNNTINGIYPLLNIYATIAANILLPGCEIGTTPMWDLATGQQHCVPQVDSSLTSFFWSNIWTWIGYGAVVFSTLLIIFFFTYIPDGWLNIKWNATDYVVDKYTSISSFFE